MCCNVLRCVAVCCSVLQCVAVFLCRALVLGEGRAEVTGFKGLELG